MGSKKRAKKKHSFTVSENARMAYGVHRPSRNGVYLLQLAIFVVGVAVPLALFWAAFGEIGFIAAVVSLFAGVLLFLSVHIAQQWERIVVMRLGKFHAVKGPGVFFTIPFVDYCSLRVDQRIRSTAFSAEETLTSDLVPLDVDAVLFWMVHDPKAACMVVDDYELLVLQSSQTILRDAIGRANVAEVTSRREQLDRELKRLLEEKVAPWGITVLSVEVRDILLPKELQDVMSMEAQAEQKRKARLTLMEAEQDISSMIGDIAVPYDGNDDALQLRQMHLLYEGMREGKGSVVVPSSWGESLGERLAETSSGK